MKYWLVTCPRGHCGTGHSTTITFAIEAMTCLDAMDRARRMPSVKHTSFLNIYAREIGFEEYRELRQVSAYERYSQHKAQKKRRR